MTFHAFLLVNARADSVSQPAEEMRQIPGISRVEEVSGVYDFIVEIETEARFAQISDLLMAKPWIKRVHVLRFMRTEDTRPEKSTISESTPDNKEENHRTPAKTQLYPTILP
jgi:DNA-binding Lrp family transcriptional regulator